MKKYFVVLLLIGAFLSSCTGYKDIDVRDFSLGKVKLVSTSKLDLNIKAEIYNPTKAAFVITDVQGVVYKDDVPFADIKLLDDAIVPPNFDGTILIKTRVNLLDPLSVLVMGLNINSWDHKEFKLKLKVTVKKGGLKKTFKLNNIPLEKVVKRIKL